MKTNGKISTEAGLTLTSNSRGITLVALIITIIVMLILVAVTITIAIKGNLFGTAKSGAKGMTIEAYRENLEAIRVNAMMEQIKNNLTTVEFMDKVEEGIIANKAFEERQELKKTSKSVKVTTKEGYLFKITENKVMYMEEQGELTLDLVTDKNTFFTYNPSTPTKGPVKVSIDISVDEEELGAILEYSTDGNTWQEYTEAVTLENNGDKIYARLYSEEEDEVGSIAEDAVENIDRLSPKQFVPTATAEGYYSIKLEGSTEDTEASATNGSSGIKAYYYSKDNGETWLPEGGTTDTSYTFEKLKDNETYTGLKMRAIDNAGNEIITEEQITVTLPEAPVPHVGDYIDYQPDTVTTPYTLYGKYSGYGITSSNTTGTDQEISQDTLNWQILKIYEDGSMDIIGSPTNTKVFLQGELGYNNGVYLLHDMCKYLYSKPSEGIEARSVNLEDFENAMTEAGKTTRDAYKLSTSGVQYGHPYTFKGSDTYYPNLYAEENGSGVGIETLDVEELKKDGISASDKYYSEPTEETYSPETTTSDSRLTITQTYYSISINKTNFGDAYVALVSSTRAWIASRRVGYSSGRAIFGLPNNEYSIAWALNTGMLFDSYYKGANTGDNSVRPIIKLQPSIELELSNNATSATAPHKIVKY